MLSFKFFNYLRQQPLTKQELVQVQYLPNRVLLHNSFVVKANFHHL